MSKTKGLKFYKDNPYEWLKDFGHSMRLKPKVNRHVSKPIKPSILHSFKFNNIRYTLFDDREISTNNFTLELHFPNRKKLVIHGVNKILNHLSDKCIPRKYKLIVEKYFMERV